MEISNLCVPIVDFIKIRKDFGLSKNRKYEYEIMYLHILLYIGYIKSYIYIIDNLSFLFVKIYENMPYLLL